MKLNDLLRLAAVVAICALWAAAASAAQPFAVWSAAYRNGGTMPDVLAFNAMGCTGSNLSPEVSWKGVPAGTKSFALTLWDPDAPHPGGWWHWIAFDVPATATGLRRGAGSGSGKGAGVEGTTSFGSPGYGGPCPPPGDVPHHYILTLYALDETRVPGAGSGTTGPQLGALIAGHVLAKATWVGRYGR